MAPRTVRAALLASLSLLSACTHARPRADAPREEALPPREHAHGAPEDPAPRAKLPNRDPHGDPDVARYVERLESPDRVADLQIDLVVERIAPAPDAVIGDLGCGPGLFAVAFARACPKGVVYASDVEPGQLDRLRGRIRESGARNVVPVLSSVDDPHFPAGRIDVVFLGDTYHHLRDRVAYFERLKAALAPGGRLAVLEYKPGEIPVGPPADHKLPAGVMASELERAGYELLERFETHPWHDFEIWAPRDAERAR